MSTNGKAPWFCLFGFVFLLVFHQKIHLAQLIEYLLSKVRSSSSSPVCLVFDAGPGYREHTNVCNTHQVSSDKHKLRFAPRMLEAVESQVSPPS